MPLNLSVSDGDFTPYLKYNAKAGRFYAKPENGDEVEITNPALAIDMANIKTGWIFYPEGAGPEKVWDPSPETTATKPPGPKKFKRGFEVQVIGNAMIPGTQQLIGLREFSSTASNVITSILRMHAEYEAGLTANPGKVPVYVCKSVKPITGSYGVNYEPIFTLVQWVERSRVAEFDAHVPTTLPKRDPISSGPQRTNGSQSTDYFADDPGPGDDNIPF